MHAFVGGHRDHDEYQNEGDQGLDQEGGADEPLRELAGAARQPAQSVATAGAAAELRRQPPSPGRRDLPRPPRPPRDSPARGPLDRLAELDAYLTADLLRTAMGSRVVTAAINRLVQPSADIGSAPPRPELAQ